jgi:hypothetical protein
VLRSPGPWFEVESLLAARRPFNRRHIPAIRAWTGWRRPLQWFCAGGPPAWEPHNH